MTRTVFLGTPEAAVPTLRSLRDVVEVVAVVTQPDKPRGRSKQPAPSPVKEAAEVSGLAVHQPVSRAELAQTLTELAPVDLGIVVAFGRILTPEMLAATRCGFLNVHFSLLPRWRGAAPVARAVMAGDTMTGVTIIRLDEGLDTGPVLTAQAVDIGDTESAGELTMRLAGTGARLAAGVIPAYLSGNLSPVDQSDEGVTYAAKLEPEDRVLSEAMTPQQFVNHVRGLAPSPGAQLDIDYRLHKILRAVAVSETIDPGGWREIAGRLMIGLESGTVEVLILQPSGKRPMTGEAWLRGRSAKTGRIGSPLPGPRRDRP